MSINHTEIRRIARDHNVNFREARRVWAAMQRLQAMKEERRNR